MCKAVMLLLVRVPSYSVPIFIFILNLAICRSSVFSAFMRQIDSLEDSLLENMHKIATNKYAPRIEK